MAAQVFNCHVFNSAVFQNACATPAPSQVFGSGSAWIIYDYRRKKRPKGLQEKVRDWVDAAYAELTAPEVKPEIRAEAAHIVRNYVDEDAGRPAVPKPDEIDWVDFATEIKLVNRLLDLWEREALERALAEDEDDAMMLGLL